MNTQSTDDYISKYDDLLSIYSEEAIKQIADELGIETRDDISLCRNAASNAGLAYLSEVEQLDATASKNELIRKIRKTGSAAQRLADNIKHLMAERRAVTAVASEFRTSREYLENRLGEKSVSMQYLAGIFKFEDEYSEPNLSQLTDLTNTLAHSLGKISTASISDPISTKSSALNRWMQAMIYFWADSDQSAPNIGHYYKELGGYKHSSVPAFHGLISLIDPSVTERAIATAIENATEAYLSDNRFAVMPALFINMFSWTALIKADRVLCSKQKLASYLGVPDEVIEGFWSFCENPDNQESSEAFVAATQKHFETKSGQKP